MTTGTGTRGVSTAIDVALALLLVSASVVVVVTFYNPTAPPAKPVASEQTAEMLSATTLRVDYTLDPVRNDDDYSRSSGVINDLVGSGSFDDAELRRTAHGPVTDLLASAAVTNATVQANLGGEDRRISLAAENFTDQMEGDIRDILTRSESQAHVVAIWRPYEGSALQGRAEAGPTPPGGEDVSLVRMTVNSRMPAISDGEIRSRYRSEGLSGVANVTADAIVDGYFDPASEQLALERGGFEAAYAGYRYERWQTVLNAWHGPNSPTLPRGAVDTDPGVDYYQPISGGAHSYNYIGGNSPRAREAADEVRKELAADLGIELRNTYSGGVTAEQLAEDVGVGEVTIVVQTW